MDVKTFVNLSLKIMPHVIEKLIPKMDEIDASMKLEGNAPGQDPFMIFGKIMGALMEVFWSFDAEFTAAGTNVNEFSAWGNEHKSEIEAFLESDLDAKAQMKEIQHRIDSLFLNSILPEI